MGPYLIRLQAGSLFLPNEIAQKIENMYPLEEGTLRTVWGPATFVPDRTTGITPGNESKTSDSSLTGAGSGIVVPLDYAKPVYGKRNHGIFHCTLQEDTRDVLLLHTSNELWEFRGWHRNWRQLLSNPAGPHGLQDDLIDDSQARFPTQFAATGNGVIIVPQDRRAYFYDGAIITPLGFEIVPNAPQGRGPQSSGKTAFTVDAANPLNGINDRAYAHDALLHEDNAPIEETIYNYMIDGFGMCRIGTIQSNIYKESSDTESTGWLLSGEWRTRVQFIDKWGNLSALSNPSDAVRVYYQPATVFFALPTSAAEKVRMSGERARKQLAWVGIPKGPDHCVGRILYRTKDLINSGTIAYHELPLDATSVSTAYATLPDNICTLYPDNIPDGWLGAAPEEMVPVPRFKLCCVAFGRLWIGNIKDAQGMIRPSLPGRWGSFPKEQELFPDPAGGEITGMRAINQGLLTFTSGSTYIVNMSDDGLRFRSAPISAVIGCEAPNSITELNDGRIVWLGYEGFYTFDGTSVVLISGELKKFFRRVTKARLRQACAAYDSRSNEYRCWLSIDGNILNNICVTYDGTGWRTRTDTSARDVCTTQDHRRYMLVAGRTQSLSTIEDTATSISNNGVFLLDHLGNKEDTSLNSLIDEREAFIETAWLDNFDSREVKTAHVVYLWLRETENSKLTIEVLRDWRNTVIETATVERYDERDVPAFWGTAQLGSESTKWAERRPYWTRAQIYVPSAETFKFRIRGTGWWEFVGVTIDEVPRYAGGSRIAP
jgi:hypothetical protein